MTSDAGIPVVFDALGRQTSHGAVVYSWLSSCFRGCRCRDDRLNSPPYDPAGTVTAQAITAPGNASAGTHSYSYDRADRLESWTDPASVVTVYVYDGANNRVAAGATAYTYDARNRLTSDGTGTYAWSPRGSMTSDAGTPVVFDALGRQTGHGTVVYSYDDLD